MKRRITLFHTKPRKPLRRSKISLKKSPLRKVGRVGKANMASNRVLHSHFVGVTECEIKLEGCLVNWTLAFAHRKKRLFYKGDVAMLSDINHVVLSCVSCHDKIEVNPKLTEEIFLKLRGPDKYVLPR